ncbi:hypothetical protein C8F04DRAFT_1200654 [Mycena alexandri]|uniref:Uncharacterized protein n=1 Tax=Mycena alexandri TaxID=1745969 RepID=A0AAD6S1V7_9AGAR|nr:hypothetical protein C8F04DRAFT_1200654 [Mycena alexandri]
MNIPFLAPCGRCTNTKDWVSVLLWQREKKDESHASGYKTVFAGQGDATSRPFLTITAHREVAHLGAKQSLQHEEDASRQAVLNHHCPMGRREETIFKQSSLLQPAKGNMPVQKGIGGFQENFAKEIINRSPPMCTKS